MDENNIPDAPLLDFDGWYDFLDNCINAMKEQGIEALIVVQEQDRLNDSTGVSVLTNYPVTALALAEYAKLRISKTLMELE